MKARTLTCIRKKDGGVAIAMLLISFTLAVTVISYLKYSVSNASLTYRARDYQQARLLATSAMDSAKAQLRYAIANAALDGTGSSLQSRLNDGNTIVQPTFRGAEKSNFNLSAFAFEVKGNGEFKTMATGGKVVEYQEVQVTVGVENKNNSAAAACTESVRVIREPFLRYILFFDDLLELHPGPKMVVDGDVRSNTDIELWAGATLEFLGKVQCPGDILLFKSDKSDDWSTDALKNGVSPDISVKVGDGYESFYQNDGYLDSTTPDWNELSQSTWKGRVTAGDSIEPITPPIGNDIDNHAIIEPAADDDTPRLQNERMANKADLYITVDAYGDVTYKIEGTEHTYKSKDFTEISGAKYTHGVYEVESGGWLNVHSDYSDPRESELAFENGPKSGSDAQDMRVVDIYMDKLLDVYPDANVVYVEVEDPSSSSLKPAVRLRNGANLTAAGQDGISIASHRTMYVEGDFNCVIPGWSSGSTTDDGKSNNGHGNNVDGVDSSNPGNSKKGEDTDPTVDDEKKNNGNSKDKDDDSTSVEVADIEAKVPVLIAADNLTVLSNAWDDDNSKDMRPGPAEVTTLNAAVMIGYNDPENLSGNKGTTFTGGAHNLIRYRENWSGVDYNFKGSYISLWNAKDSHCLIDGSTYSPPNRNIFYDTDFLTTEPPGMPVGYTEPSTVYWKEISITEALQIQNSITE